MFNGRTCVKLAAGLTLVLSLVALPARAQNWGYNPYTGGATWLGAANLFMYPFNRYSSASAPLYMASPLIWNATYYASQKLTNSNRRFNYGTYNNDELYGEPRDRTRPYVQDGNAVHDQVVHARRPDAQNNYTPAPQDPAQNPLPAQDQASVPPHSAPLAQGFIDVVNNKFSGDIGKALFDPPTRSYARAVGLIGDDDLFNADLSPQKIQTIRGILADNSEDPSVRINTVRMLLKH